MQILKAKRGLSNSGVGFGSKPPRPDQKRGGKTDKPEDYLGPGYYDTKHGFDKIHKNISVSQKYLQGNPKSENRASFLSGAARFNHDKDARKKNTTPAPGDYGRAPGEDNSFNPWFKRSYNMLFAM